MSLCCVALRCVDFFLCSFFFLRGLPQQSGSRLCGSEKKEKNSLLRLIQGEIMGPIPPRQPNPVQGGRWGGRGHPTQHPHTPKSPPLPPTKFTGSNRVGAATKRNVFQDQSAAITSSGFAASAAWTPPIRLWSESGHGFNPPPPPRLD